MPASSSVDWRGRQGLLRLVVFAIVAVVALGLARRAIVLSWFETPGAEPVTLDAESGAAPTAARVRVVLIDGLGLADANNVAALDRVCLRGHEVVVDVGFPTVSLPIQHVLWTGLTQQQSGVLYSNRRLIPPPAFAIPARVPSVAVAESHGEIVRSFGFGTVHAPPDGEVDDAWVAEGFAEAAARALRSDLPLSFVHILRVDDAGHAHGRDSDAYRAAALAAGDLVEHWMPTTIADDEVWLWLADHGHGKVGGHGDAEPSIRRVRACMVSGSANDTALPETVRLIDVAASLSAWLGVPLPTAAAGVPMRAHTVSATADLPATTPGRLLLAAAIVVIGLVIGHHAGRRVGLLPWWLVVAYLGFVALHGVPSLTLPPVFPRYGAAAVAAGAPGGLVALAVSAFAVRRGAQGWPVLVAQLAAPAAIWLGIVFASREATVLPFVSAHASVLASLLQAGVIGSCVGVVLGLSPIGSRRRSAG